MSSMALLQATQLPVHLLMPSSQLYYCERHSSVLKCLLSLNKIKLLLSYVYYNSATCSFPYGSVLCFENLILPSCGGYCGCGPVVTPQCLHVLSLAVPPCMGQCCMVSSGLPVGVGECRGKTHNIQHLCDQHGRPWPGQALVTCCT